MKRISSLIKSYLAIILGALLLLTYMNALAGGGAVLAIGIIAMVLATFFIISGMLSVLMGDKLGEKVKNAFTVIGMVSYPAFLFTTGLIGLIDDLVNNVVIGPTGWVITIILLAASLLLAVIYLITKLAPSQALVRLTQLFAGIFALALLLTVLFNGNGVPTDIGDITFVEIAIDLSFLYMLFQSLGGLDLSIAEPKKLDNWEEQEPEEKTEEKKEK